MSNQMLTIPQALIYTFAMGAVILFCRAFPFLFFRQGQGIPGAGKKSRRELFLAFVEKIVPPAAMTVLAFNAIAGSLQSGFREGRAALIAAAFTALVHLWKRNPLISIFGGTAVYMILANSPIARELFRPF
ncbi:branched-chain amino acid transport protein AzlD [Spirochaetia bacterium]|nr:branched-chain amino acid transport protein AzlD [Spirochaetia bacterium]